MPSLVQSNSICTSSLQPPPPLPAPSCPIPPVVGGRQPDPGASALPSTPTKSPASLWNGRPSCSGPGGPHEFQQVGSGVARWAAGWTARGARGPEVTTSFPLKYSPLCERQTGGCSHIPPKVHPPSSAQCLGSPSGWLPAGLRHLRRWHFFCQIFGHRFLIPPNLSSRIFGLCGPSIFCFSVSFQHRNCCFNASIPSRPEIAAEHPGCNKADDTDKKGFSNPFHEIHQMLLRFTFSALQNSKNKKSALQNGERQKRADIFFPETNTTPCSKSL